VVGISRAVAVALAFLIGNAHAQNPEMVLGTTGGEYELFTPQAVVSAGGGSTSTIPYSTATPKVESGSGAAGTQNTVSRGDHVHPAAGGAGTLSDNTPTKGTAAGAPGTANQASRSDHSHPPSDQLTAFGQKTADLSLLPAQWQTAPSDSALFLARVNRMGSQNFEGACQFQIAPGSLCWQNVCTFPGNDQSPIPLGHEIWVFAPLETAGAAIPEAGNYRVRLHSVVDDVADRLIPASEWRTPLRIDKDRRYPVSACGPAGQAIIWGIGQHTSGNFPRATLEISETPFASHTTKYVGDITDAVGGLPTLTGNADKLLTVNSSANGTEWETRLKVVADGLPSITGNKGKHLAVNTGETGMEWVAPPSGTGVQLSDSNPQPLGPPAAPGDGTKASRDDHVHGIPAIPAPSTAVPSALEAQGAAGTATVYSRGDHAHPSNIPAPPNVANSDAYLRGRLGSYTFHTGTIPPLVSSGSAGDCVKIDQGRAALVYDDCEGLPSLSGNAKSVLSIKSDASAVEWVSPTTVILEGAGIQAADKGKLVAANSAGNGIQLQTPQDAVIAGLPALTGHGGNCLKANSGATGLEFAACGGGGGGGGNETTLYSASVEVSSGTASATILGNSNTTFKAAVAALAPGELWVIAADADDRYSANFDFDGYSGSGHDQFIAADNAGSLTMGNDRSIIQLYREGLGGTFTLSLIHRPFGGGGGGSGGPAIPDPTAAGKLKHLRVNAAGAAYELADPPPDLTSSLQALTTVVGDNGADIDGVVRPSENSATEDDLSNGLVYTLGACTVNESHVRNCKGGYAALPAPPTSLPYGAGWSKISSGTIANHSSGAGINLTVTDAAIHAGLRVAKPWREFRLSLTWTNQSIWMRDDIVFPGIDVAGTGAGGPQANATADLFGTVTGVQRTCSVRMAVDPAKAAITSHSGCVPGFGSSGTSTLYWTLWGVL